MQTITELRAACAGLPGTIETFPFDATTLVFKVGASVARPTGPKAAAHGDGTYRMYALTSLEGDPVHLSLKCDPARTETLRAKFPAIRPGYHLDKRHWNTLVLDGSVPDDLVLDLLRHSYELVCRNLPRSVRDAVGSR